MSERRVGLLGAVAIGVGSMLGAGVFVAWGPASGEAGAALPAAVALAGAVAALNAGSTAHLAARHPVAGGAYAYGRAELGRWPGFLAGIAFVVGKTASIAAVALAIGYYLWPSQPSLVATVAIAASWTLNSRGITRTSAVATALAALTVAVLAVAVAVAAGGPGSAQPPLPARLEGVPAAAAILFFAFAGCARIATLGEEVKDPSRVIPRAIAAALGIVLALAIGLAVVLPAAVGDALATASAPIVDAVEGTWLPRGVIVAAAVAAAGGSLLALTAGVGRTSMAMAREGDLPRVLGRQNGRGVPALAEGASAVASAALVWAGDLTLAIGMSSFAVLLYYAVANVSAYRSAGGRHVSGWRMPRAASALGALACVALMASLPAVAVAGAVAALAVAVGARLILR